MYLKRAAFAALFEIVESAKLAASTPHQCHRVLCAALRVAYGHPCGIRYGRRAVTL